MSMTKEALRKFVAIRNKSEHASNLQVQFDAEEAGFSVGELPTPEKLGEGHYRWNMPLGILIEKAGRWSFLEPK